MAEGSESNLSEITALVYHDFNVDEEQTDLISSDIDEFRDKLEEIIAYLLEKDFERLLTAMYRLDIDEKKFSEVLQGKYGSKVSLAVADLVIDRELKKIETRRKYRV